ncbi:MAG TPA: hypothetical protein PLR99_11100 [Polyangiaceae bacterium]|nr:hypothetical protein [Polyangiaceae bacterium]
MATEVKTAAGLAVTITALVVIVGVIVGRTRSNSQATEAAKAQVAAIASARELKELRAKWDAEEAAMVAKQRADLAALLAAPELAALRADITKVIPELRAMAAAARRKSHSTKDGSGQCMLAFRNDLRRTHELGKIVKENISRAAWPEPQQDLASAFEDVLMPMRECINCVEDDVRACAQVDKAIGVLQKELVKRPSP